MRKAFLNIMIIGVISGAVSFFAGRMIGRENTLYYEVGVKSTDFKWLSQLGKISEEEHLRVQIALLTSNMKELKQTLDEVLEGKEAEYLAEQSSIIERLTQISIDN